MHGRYTAITQTGFRARCLRIRSSICRCCLPRCWSITICGSDIMRLRILLALCATVLVLAACGKKTEAFQNTDVTGLTYGRDFSLHDHNGKLRTLADFRDKAVVVFFGFTQCPDV